MFSHIIVFIFTIVILRGIEPVAICYLGIRCDIVTSTDLSEVRYGCVYCVGADLWPANLM